MKPLWCYADKDQIDQAWYPMLKRQGWQPQSIPPETMQSDHPVLWTLSLLDLDEAVRLENTIRTWPCLDTAHESLSDHLAMPVVCLYATEKRSHGLVTLKETLRDKGVFFCSDVEDVEGVLLEAETVHKKLKRLVQENTQLREKLQQRALIEQAKGRLMQMKNLSENEAYHWMRRQAMNEGQKLVVFAQKLLNNSSGQF
ncbi:ANTAR domain-containing response regulator [Thiomicrospira sp. WB1]|uniref:ANTAR domain-containing response regulator n=1 Tax=Thiomicrospira sp. WB1 TaxID=1685380 RepID=UPI0007481003|nr:ANTAR domain-containing protein [Thiomicrospira sp. WB1]KUJ72995.1 hypothetical protein AVO41_04325 [Thiomicrospira sp. WB1]